ncbi:MAG: flippase-like domain-containing protein [Oligoflexia bacterium]|nr:flippase-like domain-containing protein [Oligoflexia bacterium]
MLKYFLKFIVSASLVYWLFQRGVISVDYLKTIFNQPMTLVTCLTIFFIQSVLSATRFLIILRSSFIKGLSFLKVYSLNYVGLFFNTFLPGSVSGDFFKAYYLKDHSDNDYQKSLLISLSDRLIGLVGLFVLMFLGTVYLKITTNINVDIILYLISSIIFGMICGLFIIVKFKAFFRLHLKSKTSDGVIKTKLRLAIKTILNVIARPKVLMINILISLFIQLANVMVYYYLTKSVLPSGFNPAILLAVIPIASFVSGLPISFSGIGVTHIALQQLLKQYGIDDGANMFNGYLVIMIIFNFFGIIPFILLKKDNKKRP